METYLSRAHLVHGNIYDSHGNLRWVGCVNDVKYQLKYNSILFSSLDWKISSDWEKTTPCLRVFDMNTNIRTKTTTKEIEITPPP